MYWHLVIDQVPHRVKGGLGCRAAIVVGTVGTELAGPWTKWWPERHLTQPHLRATEHNFCFGIAVPSSIDNTHTLLLLRYPKSSTSAIMFAARQVTQSVFGAAQRRAFSASASNVRSAQRRSIGSTMKAHSTDDGLYSFPRSLSSVPAAGLASRSPSSSSSTRALLSSRSSISRAHPVSLLMSRTSTPRAS